MAAAHTQRCTVVGVFEDNRRADQAVADLMRAGFRKDQIGVAMRHSDSTQQVGASPITTTDEGEGSHAGSGALTGALTGLGLGALAGLGVLAGVIPVVGPAIAAGTLGVVLSNAAAGVGIGGLVGSLIGAGIPEEEAEYYHKEFEAGRTIVTVQADQNASEARDVLRRNGAYDVTDRASSSTSATTGGAEGTYRSGTTARAMDTGVALNEMHSTGTTHGTTHGTAHATGHGSETFQAKEEHLHAEKRPVEKGEVNVRKEVHTETQTLEVPVKREEVVIERTPGHGQPTSFNADDIGTGEQIRIPVREEQVNVSKEAVVTEEVKVGKHVVQDTEKVSGQVRKEEIKVDKTGDVDVKERR